MRKILFPALGLVLLANGVSAQEKVENKPVTTPETAKTAQQAAPQTPQGDARVRTALERMQLKYSLDAQGTFRLIFNINDRRQNVFVDSHTQQFGGFEIRTVSSTAYKVEGDLPAAKATALLADNARRKIGAWRTAAQGGSTYVIYTVQIPANTDDALLRMAIAAAMQSADDMEKQETGKDEF